MEFYKKEVLASTQNLRLTNTQYFQFIILQEKGKKNNKICAGIGENGHFRKNNGIKPVEFIKIV